MALGDIDRTRALRTDDELIALVKEIRDSPQDTQETNSVEWKDGELALGAAAGKFAVSKAILAFSNRSVEQAHLAFEGVAYMVVGVEPGALTGVSVVDHADLSQAIKSYVDGPRWSPRYVLVDGVSVLVIVVEPPRPGDPPHTLQKEYDKYRPGTIFHRGVAQSEPAGPAEVRMLTQRSLDGQRQPSLDLVLQARAGDLVRLDLSAAAREQWCRRHEASVRANSGQPESPPAGDQPLGLPAYASMGGHGIWGRTYADKSAEFDKSLAEYMTARRNNLTAQIVRRVVERPTANKVSFRVKNDSDEPVTDVRLMVRCPKVGIRVHTTPPRVGQIPPTPLWPDDIRFPTSPIPRAMRSLPEVPPNPRVSRVAVDDDDMWTISFDIGDLRPHQVADAGAITIVPDPDTPDPVAIEMVASAMNRRGIVKSTKLIPVSPTAPWPPTSWIDPTQVKN